MKNLTHYMWFTFLLLLIISTNVAVSTQENPVFADQDLSGRNTIAVYWYPTDSSKTFAIQTRSSQAIFILDDNLNEITSLDPFSDTIIPEGVGGVIGLGWNPAGTHLAVHITETYIGDVLQIWDVSAGTFESFSFEPFAAAVWSPQGDLISIKTEGSVIIWDVENQSIIHEFTLPGVPVIQSVAWKSDGSQIAVVNIRGMLRILDIATGNVIMELNAGNALLEYSEIIDMGNPSFWSISWEPNSDRFAAFDRTNDVIEIWDVSSQTLITSSPISESFVSLSWGEGGLATIFESIKIWDIATGNLLQEISLQSDERFEYIRWHPTLPELFTIISDPDLQFQDRLHSYPAPPQTLSIVGMTLLNSDTGVEIRQLVDADIFDLASTESSNLAIRADVLPVNVGSIIFDLNGSQSVSNIAPHTIPMPSLGVHTLTTTPYSDADGTGTAGTPLTITFTIVDTSVNCDFTIATGDSAGLVVAIDTANGNGVPSTICVEGTYTFTTVDNSTYGGNALPLIDSDITIIGTGGGATLQRDLAAPNFRFFYVDSDGVLTLDNLTIQNADVGSSNGGAIYNIGVLNINNSTLSNNTTTGAGGAIRSSGGTTTITNSVLDNNSSNNGGAIRNSTNPIIITNTTLSNNTATGYGGAIYTSGGINLTDSTLSANVSGNSGGGLYNSAGAATVTNTGFNGNQGNSGGGLYIVAGSLLVDNSTFDGNTATNDGGAIRASTAITLQNGTTLINNHADDDGGGLYSADDVTITNSIVSFNSAVDLGGGLFTYGDVVSISGTVIDDNTGRTGGGMFNNGSDVTFTGGMVRNNITTDDGAGIFNEAGSLAVSDSTFDNNQAADEGGGIDNGATLTVTGSIFTNNSSAMAGGAFYNDSSAANSVAQTCISGNTAPTGGGVYSLTANFDALNNWWGATDGPSESGTGSGDGVNGNVLFTPYLGACPN